MTVELVPIVEDNVRDVCDLAVAPEQTGFVAPNAWSLAQAHAECDIAWPRATGELDDDEVVARLDLAALSTADANGSPP